MWNFMDCMSADSIIRLFTSLIQSDRNLTGAHKQLADHISRVI